MAVPAAFNTVAAFDDPQRNRCILALQEESGPVWSTHGQCGIRRRRVVTRLSSVLLNRLPERIQTPCATFHLGHRSSIPFRLPVWSDREPRALL